MLRCDRKQQNSVKQLIILQQKNKLKKTMLVLIGGNIIADDEFKELRDQSIKRIICMQLKLLIKIATVMQ